MVKRLRPREKQRRANVRKFQHDKKQNSEHKLARNIATAESQITEVKELAKVLRPFLTNGAIILGNAWDEIMHDQIDSAINGYIQRPLVNTDTGDVVLDGKGEPVMVFKALEVKDQIAARKHLIDTFPKLIPEEAMSMDVDPLVALARQLQDGGGGKMALHVEIEEKEHEPSEDVIDGVARFINDDDGTGSAIDLSTANA